MDSWLAARNRALFPERRNLDGGTLKLLSERNAAMEGPAPSAGGAPDSSASAEEAAASAARAMQPPPVLELAVRAAPSPLLAREEAGAAAAQHVTLPGAALRGAEGDALEEQLAAWPPAAVPARSPPARVSVNVDGSGPLGADFVCGEGGAFHVRSLVAGGLGERAGLRVGDEVVAMRGASTHGWGRGDYAAQFSGPRPLSLEVLRS
jgi:hypothetical protein